MHILKQHRKASLLLFALIVQTEKLRYVRSVSYTHLDDLSDLYQEMLDNFGNVNTYAYCWDVRIDAASNEVLGRETPNLALGSITPEEWAAALDEAVKQNVG